MWLLLQTSPLFSNPLLFLTDREPPFGAAWALAGGRADHLTPVTLPALEGEIVLRGFLASERSGAASAAEAAESLAGLCRRSQGVVAWGEPAARAVGRTCRRPTLVLGMPRQSVTALWAETAPTARTAIYLEADPALNLRVIRALLPAARTVGVLVPTPVPGWLAPLRDEARRLEFALEELVVTTDLAAVRTLRGSLPRLDAVLLPPEPSLINEWSLKPLLLMTVRQGVPAFGGLTERYVAAGALAAVVADEDALPAQARPLIAELLQGRAPAPAYPTAVRVALNPTVARTLGVAAPAVDRARALFARP